MFMATNRPTGAGEAARKRTKARPPAGRPAPSEEEVRILAYQLYVRRCANGIEGDASSDWAEAERQLRRQ
jgi:hypothetical protein